MHPCHTIVSTILSRGQYVICDIASRNFDHYVLSQSHISYILKKCECHANKISSSGQTSWTIEFISISSIYTVYIFFELNFKLKFIYYIDSFSRKSSIIMVFNNEIFHIFIDFDTFFIRYIFIIFAK